ncbi:MAG: Ig-like domain-containing protein [Alphaproteobacteria bacterium]|nr:Ig-like domain-containing protein [Alphaproteobacteria bacterium]
MKDPSFTESAARLLQASKAAPEDPQPARPQTSKPHPGNVALAVTKEIKARLQETLEPRYPKAIGEHITLKNGVKFQTPEAEAEQAKFQNAAVEAYASADDGRIQSILVRVNGAEINPNNGRPYHITWSLDPDADVPAHYNKNGKPSKAKPVHAGVIAGMPEYVTPMDEPIRFTLSAAFFPEASAAPAPKPQLAPSNG